MKHVYCVSYSWSNSAGSGFGNIEITATRALTKIEDIRSTEKIIREKLNEDGATAVVLNLMLLRVEEENADTE